MLKLPAIFFCLFLPLAVIAQRTVNGRVTDAGTGLPVPGCSVFISGSSRGTVSGADGFFELTGIPAGKNDLVVSSVGYETFVVSYTDNQLPLQLQVNLKMKAKELAAVVLEPYVEEGWDIWGRVFTENFIGTTPNADRCRISNAKKMRFRYYKKSNRLVAVTDEPLLIENKALGYIIKYQLEEFEINFSLRSTIFLGYPFYVETGKKEKKREEVYYGSVMHFMRSLYSNRLAEEGFEVRRMQRIPNLEKQRVKALYRKNIEVQAGSNKMVTVGPGALGGDSAAYYRQVLAQPDHRDIYANDLLTADSLLIGQTAEYKQIWFDHYIQITYKKGVEDPAYVKNQYPPRKPWFPRSLVTLIDGNVVYIDETGNYYNPQDFFTTWYWSWSEKIANSLPTDYRPGSSEGK